MSPAFSIPSRLRLQLLGEMQITVDGKPPSGKVYGKMLALLAFLALEAARSHPREHLAEMFWPGLSPDAARTNLRQTLYNLRRILKDEGTWLLAGREAVRFAADSPLGLDVRDFLDTPVCTYGSEPARCADCGGRMERMERGAALYRGEFLAGLTVDDAPDFEAWRAAWRETLHRRMLSLLERLRLCQERHGALDRALLHARRYIELEPWDEEGHRELMRLLAAAGRRSEALAQYEACRALLERELGVAPEQSTRRLAERIRDGAHESPRREDAGAAAAPMRVLFPERRQVTVLHCCLSVPDETDPEEIAERLRSPYERCADIVRRYGAHLVPGLGGAVAAYFGYPAAFEDAARRAVRAALAIVAAGGAPGVCVRIGIHTGTIVTGNLLEQPDPAGVASKVALLLGERAGPGEAVISDATRRLVNGYFHLKPAGLQPLAESLQPIRTFRVAGETGASSRLDAASHLLPLVGRGAELGMLKSLRDEVSPGKGRRAVLRGEAGMGKSRLLRALSESLAGLPWSIRALHCQEEYRSTPLHPVIVLIERLLACGPDETPAVKRDMLAAYLDTRHAGLREKAAPVLEAMLGIVKEPSALPPDMLKQETIAVMLAMLRDEATRQPLLLAVEDLHWADPSTLELLAAATQQCGDAPILAVYTVRSEYPLPAWLAESSTVLDLAHLDDEAMTALVMEAEADLAPEMVRRIVARAEGIPLFGEELAHQVAEAGPAEAQIPATLGYLLAARLDAAEKARRVAQIAATMGREFDLDLLGRVAAADADSLRALQDARLVVVMGNNRFEFRHALIQEAAYQSQTRADRQAAHRRVADALIAHFPQRAAQEPAQVARHLTEAGAAAEAIPWWLAAGRRALGAHACAEAADHLRSGLALIEKLPAGTARESMELDLLLSLGQSLLALHGYGSPEAAAVYDRAFELCREDGGHVRSGEVRFEVLWGLWMVSSSRENSGFDASASLVPRLLAAAGETGDPMRLGHANAAAANLALWQGRFEEANRYAQAAVAACSGHPRQRHRFDGHDPQVAGLAYASWACHAQGKVSEALAACEEAIAIARRLEHPDSLCFALVHAATVHRFLHDVPAVAELARETLALAGQYRLALWQVAGTMLLGWTQARGGDRQGIALLEGSAAAVRGVMPGILVAFLHPLAEGHGFLGDDEAQLKTIADALATADRLDEHFHRADLHRLRGDCLQRLGRPAEALAALREAVCIASKQDARAVAMRAEASLAVLLREEGEAPSGACRS